MGTNRKGLDVSAPPWGLEDYSTCTRTPTPFFLSLSWMLQQKFFRIPFLCDNLLNSKSSPCGRHQREQTLTHVRAAVGWRAAINQHTSPETVFTGGCLWCQKWTWISRSSIRFANAGCVRATSCSPNGTKAPQFHRSAKEEPKFCSSFS